MIESKTEDGDEVQPVVPVVLQCRVETMPASFWFKVVTFLAWSDDASAMHATSKAVRDHTVSEWQRIELPRKGICGELPETLAKHTNLTVLDMSGNELSGPPLQEMIKLLSPLAKLEELNLGTIFKEKPPCRSGNFFGGTLHYADVAVFTKLKKLDLSNTSLHGELPKVLELAHLTYFDVSQNSIRGTIPAEFGQLVNLRTLRLFKNKLTGALPKELGNLVNLTSLVLFRNKFQGDLPKELGKLINLEIFVASGNSIGGESCELPKELGKLLNLKVFSVSDNSIRGTIPVEFGQLFNLKYLSLRNNQLTVTDEEMTALKAHLPDCAITI